MIGLTEPVVVRFSSHRPAPGYGLVTQISCGHRNRFERKASARAGGASYVEAGGLARDRGFYTVS